MKLYKKNFIAFLFYLIFCLFLVYSFIDYRKKNILIVENNNDEVSNFYYDVVNMKRNEIGILNDDNRMAINDSTNLNMKNNILKLIESVNSDSYKNFEGEYRKEIEKILRESKALFMGDSNVKHFEYYDILDKDLYFANEGKNIFEQAKLIENINSDIKNIILFNGYNLDKYNNSEEYIEAYLNIIDKLKNKLPDCNIYICSLLPATYDKIKEDFLSPLPHNIYRGKEFDMAIENYQFEDATYIDTKWIVRDTWHKEDGVHMTKEFYEILIPYVAYFINL